MYPCRPRECDLITPASVLTATSSCALQYCEERKMKKAIKSNRKYFKLNLQLKLVQYIILLFKKC
jgi:hypothetical protein